jgi:hypothetical protein
MEEKIDVKIVPKEQKFWIDLKEKLLIDIERANNEIIINENIIKLCDEKIKVVL